MSNLPPTASPQEICRALEENLWALWCRFGKAILDLEQVRFQPRASQII